MGRAAFGARGCGMDPSVMLLSIWPTPRKKPSRIPTSYASPTNIPGPCIFNVKAKRRCVAFYLGRAGIRADGAQSPGVLRWGSLWLVAAMPRAVQRCPPGVLRVGKLPRFSTGHSSVLR